MLAITGSAGHLGEGLMRTCDARGLAARGTDLVASDFTQTVGDLADPKVAARATDGCRAIIHTATLHKPHVATHTRQQFVDTNITVILALLEQAKRLKVPFVFCSTTSAFGAALSPPQDAPAAWITEAITPVPKNIYGVTKTSAEELCHLFARKMDVPVVILRLSRFFPEPDDDPRRRKAWPDTLAKLNEFAFRRIGLEDAVEACLLAVKAAPRLGFARYIISGPTPFKPSDCTALRRDAPGVLEHRVPGATKALAALGWQFFPTLDRVYNSAAAQRDLSWGPKQTFRAQLARVQDGKSVLGDLADAVGIKGYHGDAFADGIYPTD